MQLATFLWVLTLFVGDVASLGIAGVQPAVEKFAPTYVQTFLPLGTRILTTNPFTIPLPYPQAPENPLAYIVAIGDGIGNAGDYIASNSQAYANYLYGRGLQTGQISRLREGDIVMLNAVNENNPCRIDVPLNRQTVGTRTADYCVVTVADIIGVVQIGQFANRAFPDLDPNVGILNNGVSFAGPAGGLLQAGFSVVSINDVTVSEETNQATLTISSNIEAINPIRLTLLVVGGTAIVDPQVANAATDATGTVGSLLPATIPAGASSTQISFPIRDDTVREPTEFFDVRIVAATGALISEGENIGTVTILDNDTPAIVAISPPVTTVTEGDEFSIVFSLDRAVASDVTLFFTIEGEGNEPGSVADLQNIPNLATNVGSTVIAQGKTNQIVTLRAAADQIVEFTEAIKITVTNIQSSSTVIRNANANMAIVNIISNDRASLQIQPNPEQTVNENAGSVTLTVGYITPVGLDPNSRTVPADVRVQIGFSNPPTGPAASPNEYVVPNPSVVVIPRGSNSVQLTIDINDDILAEPTERFQVTLLSEDGLLVQPPTGDLVSTLVAIIDNELSVSISDANPDSRTVSIPESSSGTVTVRLSSASTQAITVVGLITYAAGVGQASIQDLAPQGTVNQVTATIPPGQLVGTFTISPFNDNVNEPAETFTITIQDVVAPVAITAVAPTTATVTIPVDPTDAAVIAPQTAAITANEGTTANLVFTVTPAADTPAVITLTCTGVTAQNADFTLLTTQQTVTSPATQATFQVRLEQENVFEPNESVRCTASVLPANRYRFNAGADFVTITIADISPVVEFAAATVDVTRPAAGSPAIRSACVINMNGAQTFPVVVGIAASSTSTPQAIAGTDYLVDSPGRTGNPAPTEYSATIVVAGTTVDAPIEVLANAAGQSAPESVTLTLLTAGARPYNVGAQSTCTITLNTPP